MYNNSLDENNLFIFNNFQVEKNLLKIKTNPLLQPTILVSNMKNQLSALKKRNIYVKPKFFVGIYHYSILTDSNFSQLHCLL